MHSLIEQNREAIAGVCRRYGVHKLEVFGSILRADFDAARSDIDVLVEFEQDKLVSFSQFMELKDSLEALFGRAVDLIELSTVRNRRLRYYIERSKAPVYAAA
jgi:uncharacterized protein